MTLRILGARPLACESKGRLKSRIATIFPRHRTLVTLPGIHATQRLAFLDYLESEHLSSRGEPLSPTERTAAWGSAVDLIVEENSILIRPDPEQIPLMFEADVVLQEIYSKRQIRFLNLKDDRVHTALKRRGQCWRITPLPKSQAEMQRMISASKIAIGGREIYYYNNTTGTRWLTYEEFASLGALDDEALRQHLAEIRQYCGMLNAFGNPEVSFFVAGKAFLAEWVILDFAALDRATLRQTYAWLRDRFAELVPLDLRADDPGNIEWRRKIYAALFAHQDDVVSEEMLLGLSSEFYMQIEWLPGVRIEDGEVLLDSVFDEAPMAPVANGLPCDAKARAFIMNLVREYDDLEYVNVGRVPERLSKRPRSGGRRDVYLVEMKQRGSDTETVKVIRLQKWGVWERLDKGIDLERAMIETEEYTEYVLDRRLGCRQVGMRLLARIIPRKIIESYNGRQQRYLGSRIWSPYFERDYIRGIATDKIPPARFENQEFALRFAALLGQAAAPNIVVGRSQDVQTAPGQKEVRIMFDDGDEILVEDADGMPKEILLTDHTGSFWDYETPLEHFAPQYALPLNCRAEHVPDAQAFADAYLSAFLASFRRIQDEFRRESKAFLNLFMGRSWDERGSFADRWPKVLQRLDRTDPEALTEAIRCHLTMGLRSADDPSDVPAVRPKTAADWSTAHPVGSNA